MHSINFAPRVCVWHQTSFLVNVTQLEEHKFYNLKVKTIQH